MKMELGLAFLVHVLLYLFICTCHGSPPAGQKSGTSRTKFTDEEDNLIVTELSAILDGVILPFKREVWDRIENKHSEKRQANTRGFPRERSAHCLRSRFKSVLMNNRSKTNVKVPEDLIRKIIQAHALKLEKGGHDKHRYNEEENNFIIEVLLTTPFADHGLCSVSTVEEIRKAHDEKRLADTPGFKHVRTGNSLRKQLYQLKQKDQLPQEIIQKFLTPLKVTTGASSSSSSAPIPETDLQDEDIYGDILKNPLLCLDISEDD